MGLFFGESLIGGRGEGQMGLFVCFVVSGVAGETSKSRNVEKSKPEVGTGFGDLWCWRSFVLFRSRGRCVVLSRLIT